MRLSIVGSRQRDSISDYHIILNWVKKLKPDLIVSGGCKYGAYYTRNKLIAEDCDKLLAVVTSDRKGGTENTIKYFLACNKKENLIIC